MVMIREHPKWPRKKMRLSLQPGEIWSAWKISRHASVERRKRHSWGQLRRIALGKKCEKVQSLFWLIMAKRGKVFEMLPEEEM